MKKPPASDVRCERASRGQSPLSSAPLLLPLVDADADPRSQCDDPKDADRPAQSRLIHMWLNEPHQEEAKQECRDELEGTRSFHGSTSVGCRGLPDSSELDMSY